MHVLILKNVPGEGPGTIEDFLRENGIGYEVADLQGGRFPSGDGADALVLMGGPMSVNEEDLYPYLTREIALARDFMTRGRKVLGVCLGAQIMAKALGARVYRGPEKEIGWYDIELQEEGVRDPLMRRLAVHPRAGDFWKKFKVFHWHGETFDLPAGALWLAKSELFPHQAFRYGGNAYAFQFHIEVRKEMVYEWLKDEEVEMARLATETETFYNDYHGRAVNFYRGFFLSDKVNGTGGDQ
ncbi:MAG: type 1 glutamine amidotransferase [Nitrospiraceae bacterium]|nr:type 1 glutamine amidotransferase [Nitrospiraceae bacterium]